MKCFYRINHFSSFFLKNPTPSFLSFVFLKKNNFIIIKFFYLPIAFSPFQNRVINTNAVQTRKAFGKRNGMHCGNVEKKKRFKECDKRNVFSKGYFGCCCCYIWIQTLLKIRSNDLKTIWVCINHLQIENKPLLKIQPDGAPLNFQLKVKWEKFLYVHVWMTRNRLFN